MQYFLIRRISASSFWTLAFLLVFFAPSGISDAANFHVDLEGAGQCQIRLSGEISTGDFQKLKSKLPPDYAVGRAGPTLCLNSAGGDFVEALKIANFVADGISTVIEAGATCESACGWIFLAGSNSTTDGSEWSRGMYSRSTLSFHAPYIEPSSLASASSVSTAGGLAAAIQAYNQAVSEIAQGLLTLGQKYATLDVSQPLIPPTLLAEALVRVGNQKLTVDTTGAVIRWSIRVIGYAGLVPRSKADIVRACILGSAVANQFWHREFISSSEVEEYLAYYDANKRTLVAEVVVSGIGAIACELEFMFDERLDRLLGNIKVVVNLSEEGSVTKAWIRDRYLSQTLFLPDFAMLDPNTALKSLPTTSGKPVNPSALATIAGPAWCNSQATKARDETVICETSRLSLYDTLLTRYYNAALAKSSTQERTALQTQQRFWLSKRQFCLDDGKCLESVYHDRIHQLKEALK